MSELTCVCGSKGGTPVWIKCQGEPEHKRKNEINAVMHEFHKNLPRLAKLLGNGGEIRIAKI